MADKRPVGRPRKADQEQQQIEAKPTDETPGAGFTENKIIENLETVVENQSEEIEKLKEQIRNLEAEKISAPAETKLTGKTPDNVPAELITMARNICQQLQTKYQKSSGIKNSLAVSAQYAFDTWLKAAAGNPATGRSQLIPDGGSEPIIEKYFRRKLFN